MGIVRLEETCEPELKELKRTLLSCAAVHRRKEEHGEGDRDNVLHGAADEYGDEDSLGRAICVTSGVSYLGIAIVNQLLVEGYSVRVLVDNQEDIEKLRERESSGELRLSNSIVEVVMAKLNDIESLSHAFAGCQAVLHTAAFVDPAGLSGYSKAMCDIEENACKNVVKACGASPSVRHCVLTSSLLACIWQDTSVDTSPCVIDHKSWSDESVCKNKKLWLALGKLRAEKAAQEAANEYNLKLATICPGLITGPTFFQRNPTSTLAYLKGIQEMYARRSLATVDVNNLAKAHVRVFQEMKNLKFERYICYDQVVVNADDMEKLINQTSLNTRPTVTECASTTNITPFELSNLKLVELMLRKRACMHL